MAGNKEDGIAVWNNILAGAMKIPGVKVDRREFLFNKLNPYLDDTKLLEAINSNPTTKVSREILDKIADSVISYHTRFVTTTSAVAGVPGGFAMIGTIPADTMQYYWHVLVLAQKLGYIYGWPDLTDKDGNLTEESTNVLTLFIGVMSGVAAANEGINLLARNLSKEVVKRLPKMALTKTVIYPIVKQVAKWLGIKVTKDSFAKGLGKIVPLLGGGISGVLTYTTFKPQAKRLKEKLSEQSGLFKNQQKKSYDDITEDAECEEVD